jgi:hypothetical protein
MKQSTDLLQELINPPLAVPCETIGELPRDFHGRPLLNIQNAERKDRKDVFGGGS